MARTKVQSELIATNAISGTIIADGAITSTHLAANCVDSSELVTGSIDTIHIAANQVTATKIVTNGVLTRHISDDQVTAAKLANSINTDIATGPAALPKAGGTMTGNLVINTAGNGLPSISLSHSNSSADNFILTGGVPGTSNAGFSIRDVDASANRLVINSSGNVGIGTDSPDRNLHIETAGDSYLRVSGNRGNANDLHVGNIEFENTFSSAGVIAEMRAITGNSGTQSTKGQLAFYTDDGSTYAERMRIDSSGNVGIGTTAPPSPLSIFGTATSSPTATNAQQSYDNAIFRINSFANSSVGLSIGSTGSNVTHIQTSYNEGTTSPLTLNPFGGNVGIGQTDPATTLHIGDGASHYVRIENAGSGDISSGYQIYRGSSVGMSLYDNPADNTTSLLCAGSLNINCGGSGADLHVNTNGKVGIGTSNPSEMLHILGGGSGPEVRLQNSSGSHYIRAYNDNWNFLANSSNTAMTIKNSGNILTPSQAFFMTNRAAGNQTFANAAWVDVDWTGEPYDTGGNYVLSTGVFTAPIAGVYLFTGLIGFNTITATNYLLARIVCSSAGDFYTTHEQKRDGGGDYGYDHAISQMIYLAASETVKMQVFAGSGGDHTLMSRSNWQGRLLG